MRRFWSFDIFLNFVVCLLCPFDLPTAEAVAVADTARITCESLHWSTCSVGPLHFTGEVNSATSQSSTPSPPDLPLPSTPFHNNPENPHNQFSHPDPLDKHTITPIKPIQPKNSNQRTMADRSYREFKALAIATFTPTCERTHPPAVVDARTISPGNSNSNHTAITRATNAGISLLHSADFDIGPRRRIRVLAVLAAISCPLDLAGAHAFLAEGQRLWGVYCEDEAVEEEERRTRRGCLGTGELLVRVRRILERRGERVRVEEEKKVDEIVEGTGGLRIAGREGEAEGDGEAMEVLEFV